MKDNDYFPNVANQLDMRNNLWNFHSKLKKILNINIDLYPNKLMV